MDVRTRILDATAELLAHSADGDVSTRAVCEAAGVAAPALYRQFGDKAGLLAAAVAHGYERYLASKRALAATADPVADLRAGWDNHVAFALENPNLYRLMWAPGLTAPVETIATAHRMLEAVLDRCAAAGHLRLPPATAAQMVMSANVGVALSLIHRPALHADPALSSRVRDAVFAAVLHPAIPTVGGAVPEKPGEPTATDATTLAARLRRDPPGVLSPNETALLQEWLARLATA